MSEGFFTESERFEFGITHHQVAHDQGHLNNKLPIFFVLGFRLCQVFAVNDIFALFAIFLCPRQRFFIFFFIVNIVLHATDDFDLIDSFATHTEVILEEIRIDDRTGNSHTYGTDRQVRLAAHQSDRHRCTCKTQQFVAHIGRDVFRISILHFMSVDAEGRQSFLRVSCQYGCQVNGSRTFGPIKSPDSFHRVRVHVHRFASVAPAGGDGNRHRHVLASELFGACGALGHPSDG